MYLELGKELHPPPRAMPPLQLILLLLFFSCFCPALFCAYFQFEHFNVVVIKFFLLVVNPTLTADCAGGGRGRGCKISSLFRLGYLSAALRYAIRMPESIWQIKRVVPSAYFYVPGHWVYAIHNTLEDLLSCVSQRTSHLHF